MILTSLTVSGVWTWTTLTQPMQAAVSWQALLHPIRQHRKVLFLQAYNTLRLRIDPILFALKALGTLISVPYYENLVCTVEAVLFSKDFRTRYPLVSRLYGLLLSYFFGLWFRPGCDHCGHLHRDGVWICQTVASSVCFVCVGLIALRWNKKATYSQSL
jgi:hypothetical protein